MRVEQKQNDKLDTHTQQGGDEAHEQGARTLRLISPLHVYLKRWLAYQSRKNHNDSGRTQRSSPPPQDAEEVPTQPTSSSQGMASFDISQLLASPIFVKPVLSSPTTPASSRPKTSAVILIRSNVLWPIIIMLSALAAGLVNFVFPDMALRPVIVFWFLLICPGMIVVRFLHLKEHVVEWTLAIALSFSIDAIVAAIQLYAGKWSPDVTLSILIGFSLVVAIVQLATNTKSVPILLRTARSRKPAVLLPILLTLLVGIIVGASLWSYEVYHGSGSAASTSALSKATTHPSPTSTVVPTPSTSSAHIAALYNGTIYDISANVTTKMSLTGIQQTQITIGGNFTGLHRTGAFNGIIDPHPPKHIQFTVKDSAGHVILSFDGHMQSDSELSGSYCNVDQDARCTGDYGLWSVAPAS